VLGALGADGRLLLGKKVFLLVRKPGQVEETAMDAGSREVSSEQCVEMVAL
jgi:hypothetical protein